MEPRLLSGRTILVVAPPHRHERLATAVSETGGFPVACSSLAEALRIVRVVRIDGLVVDVATPGVDPDELLRELRGSAQLGALPAVAIGTGVTPSPSFSLVRHAHLRWVHRLRTASTMAPARPQAPSAVGRWRMP
jgi:hypothetical protein